MRNPSISMNLANKLLAKVLADGRQAFYLGYGKEERFQIPSDFKGEFEYCEVYDLAMPGEPDMRRPDLDEIILIKEVVDEDNPEVWGDTPFRAFEVQGHDGKMRVYQVY
jgi:hypothetical protein